MKSSLKIGDLARRAGVIAKAIRFYERRQVLPPARRGDNRYRLYGAEAVDMLRFVKQATSLGLTLNEIKDIIAIRQGGRPPCPHVHRLLQDKAVELDRKLQDLLEVRRRIRKSLKAWRTVRGQAAVCAHIEQAVVPVRPKAGTLRTRRRGMKQVDLKVSGMTCGACEQRIQTALTRIDGVAQSAADHRAARVRILFDPARTSEDAVRACIERAGYVVAS